MKGKGEIDTVKTSELKKQVAIAGVLELGISTPKAVASFASTLKSCKSETPVEVTAWPKSLDHVDITSAIKWKLEQEVLR